MEKIICNHDTARRLMIHEIGTRVVIIANSEHETIKFYKDGNKYNEMSANISLSEFERILARTIRETAQLAEIDR